MDLKERLTLKDHILEEMLVHLSKNELFAENMVLQGGGAMHFIYSSPRYSVDLDFVCPHLSTIRKDLVEQLAVKFETGRSAIVPSIGKNEPGFVRVSYALVGTPVVGKLELCNQSSFDNYVTAGKFSPIRVENPGEIFADKIFATFSRMHARGSLKPTDLFDLTYLVSSLNAEATSDQVQAKAIDYDELSVLSTENIEQTISYISDPANHDIFRRDIQKTLLPDVARNSRFDKAYFERVAEQFAKYASP